MLDLFRNKYVIHIGPESLISGTISRISTNLSMLQFSKISTQLNRIYQMYDEIKSKLVLLLAVDNLRRL